MNTALKSKNDSAGLILAAVCIAQFLVPFMLTSVGVALPSMAAELKAGAVEIGLLEQLYVLSLAMTILSFGRLGDIKGQKNIFICGLFIFTTLTLSLGFAHDINIMMVLRFLQGIGASMLLSGSMAIVASAYSPEKRTRKIGIVSAFTYAGLSSGPVIGGFITSNFGWRLVFTSAAPIGITAAFLALTGMKKYDGRHHGKMDWKGSAVYAAGIGLIMTGAAHSNQSMIWLAAIAAGIISLIIFIRLEMKSDNPILGVNLLSGNITFTFSCLAALGNYASTFGITFLMSLFLQYAKKLSPREAGLILILQPLVQVAAAPFAGKLSEKYNPSKISTIGMLMSAGGIVFLAFSVTTDVSIIILMPALMIIGAGFGTFITPNTSVIMSSVERKQFGAASGMIGAMRTLGMAVSMTTAALMFSAVMGKSPVTQDNLPSFIFGLKTALFVFAIYSCLGIIVSAARAVKK